MIRSIITAICIAIISPSIFSQKLADGWKGLRPLKSTLQHEEKALGKPWRIDDNNYYNYETDEAYIEVNYSTAPFLANQYKRGKYKIPENTILDYSVIPKARPKVVDFEFDRRKYERYGAGHGAGRSRALPDRGCCQAVAG